MVLHGNISQALNSLEDADLAASSEFHINQALQNEALDAQFKQKFMYRKAKALSFDTGKYQEAIECIKGIENWESEKAIKGLYGSIENRMK